jgi:hypothetical protein
LTGEIVEPEETATTKQRLGKHVPVATNIYTMQEAIENQPNAWATLFLGAINTGTGPLGEGVSKIETRKYAHESRGTRI